MQIVSKDLGSAFQQPHLEFLLEQIQWMPSHFRHLKDQNGGQSFMA